MLSTPQRGCDTSGALPAEVVISDGQVDERSAGRGVLEEGLGDRLAAVRADIVGPQVELGEALVDGQYVGEGGRPLPPEVVKAQIEDLELRLG